MIKSKGDMLLVQRENIENLQQEVKNKKYEIRTLEERILATKNNCQKQIEHSQAEAKEYVAKEVDSWSK